ncbi:hypothetical protein [Nocardia gipuzkoensis]
MSGSRQAIGRPRVGAGGVTDCLHERFGRVTVDADLDDAEYAHPAGDQVDEGAFLELHKPEPSEQTTRLAFASDTLSSVSVPAPMLATAGRPPETPGRWAVEMKGGGMRSICRITRGRVELYSRNRNNVTSRISTSTSTPRRSTPAGHGPMEDLAVDADSGRLLTAALASGKPLAVVRHAPAALLAATADDGANSFAGYTLTGFTNAEETQAGFADKAKWLLQDRLVQIGAEFREADPWTPNVMVNRTLITGQNPAFSAGVADESLKALG